MNTTSKKYRLIYVVSDIVVTFALTILPFLTCFKIGEIFSSFTIPLIYSLSVSLATVAVFAVFKVYSIVTREFGLAETIKIAALVIAINVFGVIVLTISATNFMGDIPQYYWAWALSLVALVFVLPSTRLIRRVFNLISFNSKKDYARTIIIGAGSSGKVAIDEIRRNHSIQSKVVAFVDDDVNKIGGSLANVPIKGPISDIAKIIDFYQATEVIIAISNISRDRLFEIIKLLEACTVKIKRMPLLSEMEGPHDRRIIDFDVNDLLRREPIKLDNHEINNMLCGKTVLVTGAGGTIGSELARQIFKTKPKTLILFDIYENSTYQIQMELTQALRKDSSNHVELITLIGSTYNEFRVEQIISKYRPDFIYHAAAYKHVPLMEDSPMEAIRTNVVGTYNVAKLADKYKVKKMILVSTDKAVRPTNVMGATKRFAELIVQHFDCISKNTNYAAVRFGNVLGSNGSVVPLFKKQIETGGPITLTHKDINRYFMTIPEAVSLILQCGLFAEDGEIFILDMGKPVKIKDLAERMIRQAGLVPYVDIDIIETGLRPGEKLYEELLLDLSTQQKTSNNRIFIEEKATDSENIDLKITEICKAFTMNDIHEIKELLSKVINTYTITENAK